MNHSENDSKERADRGLHQENIMTEVNSGLLWQAHTAPFHPTHFSLSLGWIQVYGKQPKYCYENTKSK